MKIYLTLSLLLGVLVAANAQSTASFSARSTLKAGVNYLKLDAPDATGLHYTAELAHQPLRYLTLSATVGYFESSNRINVANDTYINGDFRRRLTADATIALALVKGRKNAVWVGIGPSFWHRTDKTYNQINYTLRSDGSITDLIVDMRNAAGFDLGGHAKVTYTYLLSEHLNVGTLLSLTRFRSLSIIPQIGIHIGYVFNR